MTGAAYIRVSTEEQLEFSPDSQLKKIREYAEQHQITIPEDQIYIDEGISGRCAEKRPAFQRMIASARRRPAPFRLILVWKFSRFARNRQDSILYKSMLRRECGIDVLSVSEPLTDDPTSILVEALLEAMDEYYSLNLAEEVRRGMNEKFSRGQTVSAPPFGYRMGRTHFEPDEDTAPFVPVIFQKYLQGFSLRQIAAWLNDSGIRTSRGNLFESRTVEYLLSNPVYTGKLRRRIHVSGSRVRSNDVSANSDRFYRGPDVRIISAEHLPLVSQELFDSVQQRLALSRGYFSSARRNPSAQEKRSGAAGENLFRGLVQCSACHSTLLTASRGLALQCGSYTKGRCRVSHYISLNYLTPAFFRALRECPLRLEGQLVKKYDSKSIKSENIWHPRSVRPLIRTEERRLERIRQAFESGTDSLEEYQQRKQEIQRKISALREAEKKEKEEPEDPVSSCSSFSWDYQGLLCLLDSGLLTGSEVNELLRLILSRIVFNRPECSLQLIFRF